LLYALLVVPAFAFLLTKVLEMDSHEDYQEYLMQQHCKGKGKLDKKSRKEEDRCLKAARHAAKGAPKADAKAAATAKPVGLQPKPVGAQQPKGGGKGKKGNDFDMSDMKNALEMSAAASEKEDAAAGSGGSRASGSHGPMSSAPVGGAKAKKQPAEKGTVEARKATDWIPRLGPDVFLLYGCSKCGVCPFRSMDFYRTARPESSGARRGECIREEVKKR